MKPQFANVFNVSVNDNRSECSLSFYHMYVQHNYTPQPKGLIDMPEKTVDEVASIMPVSYTHLTLPTNSLV